MAPMDEGMEDALVGPSRSGEMEAMAVRRRGSLGRALERVKKVVRRRGGKRKAEISPTASPPAQTDFVARPESIISTSMRPRRSDNEATANSMFHFGTPMDVDTTSTSSLLLPIQRPSPTASPSDSLDDKARVLFAQYGVAYTPVRRTTEEPPRKVRRVEKPIRIRLRWSCHECSTPLGLQGLCGGCGHRKCGKCVKEPPKKVRDVIEGAKESVQADVEMGNAEEVARKSRTDMTRDSIPAAPRAIPTRQAFGSLLEPLAVLEANDPHSNSMLPLLSAKSPMLMYTLKPNGRGGTNIVHRIRNAPFIDRVYKKPRQRVRWTCERCQTPFREHEVCQICDHARCEGCIRDPSPKVKAEPDPSVVRRLQARLGRAVAPEIEMSTNAMAARS
ncbi:hypothetical protein B0A48_04887 [Cryoendolithus antarcticus]|uniref:Uncharacterized protein n=1 Tax=Cryoendolithus antarcticus TaxID=1507870 RepID=A0A1V8TDN5_9PEZI|nr:hypothetical protein B0A48_04887 [Cryoendolithus antarcticus]